jgi:hypothetical protein
MPQTMTATISLTFDPSCPGDAGRVLDTFSYLATELSKRGVQANVLSPDPVAGPEGFTEGPGDDPVLDPGSADDPPVQAVTTTTTKRVRDRTAERRAAKEKADAASRAGDEAKAAQVDDPLMGATAGPGTGDPFGDDTDDDAPLPPGPDAKPAEPVERVRTPKECMDGSIVLLRQCFAQGGADAVKALQKTYKVSKFIDLPLDAAPGLWKQSLDLARTLQIKIPPGL